VATGAVPLKERLARRLGLGQAVASENRNSDRQQFE
jgi:hypothetical protein